jgi:hypothetical protein
LRPRSAAPRWTTAATCPQTASWPDRPRRSSTPWCPSSRPQRGEPWREAAAQDWFRDAFGHLKAIAACKATGHILQTAGITPDEGVFPIDTPKPFVEGAKKRFWDREPTLRTLA